jgi:hypothetical protein
MLLLRIVWSFVWRKFPSVEREEWCDEIKCVKKFKLGVAHVTPINIQEIQASKLIPLHQQNVRSSFKTLYFYCFIYYGTSLFVFLFFFSFVFCSLWLDPNIFVLEIDILHFHCIEHSSFHSYCSSSVLFC